MGACRSPLNLEFQRSLRKARPGNNPRHVFAHDRLDGRTRHRQLEGEPDGGAANNKIAVRKATEASRPM